MARPTKNDDDKRLNVGLRLHPVTLQRLDEMVEFFQNLRQSNPMLPFGFPQSRTDVVEFLLREGVRDFLVHVLAWRRIGTERELPADLDRMSDSAYWNTMLSSIRLDPAEVPQAWVETEWPPVGRVVSITTGAQPPAPPSSNPTPAAAPSRKPRKPQIT